MSATGLLALNFCDLILLITIIPLESEFQYVEYKNNNKLYVTPIYQVPFHVLIAYDELYCSGSLIRSRIVVTAASCFLTMDKRTTVVVKVGSRAMTDIGQVIEVVEVKQHEYFGQPTELNNDIALLLLKEHVKFSLNVMKIPIIDDADNQVSKIDNVRVCGWGSTSLNPRYAARLLCTDMKLTNNTECRELYKYHLSKSNFCLEYEKLYRLSDNGGPVVYQEQLIGVVSYGVNRIENPFLALATNITFYSRWIEVNVKRWMVTHCVPQPEYEYYYSSSSETDNSENSAYK